MRIGKRAGGLLCLLMTGVAARGQSSGASRQLVDRMLAHEADAGEHRNLYTYFSEERSDRTGGHLWRERVVETATGRVRLLLVEDGQPLNSTRLVSERAKLQEILAHPEAFVRREQVTKGDERHAEQMLLLVQKGVMLDEPKTDGKDLKIAYRPDPAYHPQTLEERVLHAMVGTISVDGRTQELHHIEGRVPEDVSLGFGLLGTIHAGSSFSSAHEQAPGNEWKAAAIETSINGKALLFKAIGRNEHMICTEFRLLPADISVTQAVEMLEKGGF